MIQDHGELVIVAGAGMTYIVFMAGVLNALRSILRALGALVVVLLSLSKCSKNPVKPAVWKVGSPAPLLVKFFNHPPEAWAAP